MRRSGAFVSSDLCKNIFPSASTAFHTASALSAPSGRRLALEAVFSHAGMLTPPRFARLPLPEEGAGMILNRALPFIKIDAERRSD